MSPPPRSLLVARRAVVFVVGVLALTSCAGPSPFRIGKITAEQDLPSDVVAVVDDTWTALQSNAPTVAACMGDVRLVLVDDVDQGDARYVGLVDRIEIEIPTSPARFPESLVHELAHHADDTCPVGEDVRARFVAAQGIDQHVAWDTAATWEDIPAEHFAEAIVEIVLGDRLLHFDVIKLDPEALAVVREWATSG